MTNHVYGAGLAFLGFSASLFIGLCTDNSYTTIIFRSLFVMVLFYVLGTVLASIGQKVIQENFDAEAESMDLDGATQQQESQEEPQGAAVADDAPAAVPGAQ